MRHPFTSVLRLGLLAAVVVVPCRATAAEPPQPAAEAAAMTPREKEFADSLTGAELVGFATRDDKDDGKPSPDRYLIEEAVKVDANHWRIKAGLKVGDVVLVFPLTLEVQWAGDTPVITLTDFAVGPLGTFTARVLFYRGRYAGTWSHGAKDGGNAVGGQIFGRIVPNAPGGDKKPSTDTKSTSK